MYKHDLSHYAVIAEGMVLSPLSSTLSKPLNCSIYHVRDLFKFLPGWSGGGGGGGEDDGWGSYFSHIDIYILGSKSGGISRGPTLYKTMTTVLYMNYSFTA